MLVSKHRITAKMFYRIMTSQSISLSLNQSVNGFLISREPVVLAVHQKFPSFNNVVFHASLSSLLYNFLIEGLPVPSEAHNKCGV